MPPNSDSGDSRAIVVGSGCRGMCRLPAAAVSVLAGGTAEWRGALVVGHTARRNLAGLGRLVPVGGRPRIATFHDVLDLLLVDRLELEQRHCHLVELVPI